MSTFRKVGLPTIIFVVIVAVLYYVAIPPINIKSVDFWWFCIWCVVIALVLFGSARAIDSSSTFFEELSNEGLAAIFNWIDKHRFANGRNTNRAENTAGKRPRKSKGNGSKGVGHKKPWRGLQRFLSQHGPMFWLVLVAVALVCGLIVGSIASSAFFNARAYSALLDVSDGDFATDISEISMKNVPVVDRDTAVRLGNRTIGEINDLVSQFTIDESDAAYTQINYQNAPYRVSPLVYADIIKWIVNTWNGLPGFVTVNMATQETELVRLPEGSYMHISTGEHFNNYLYRYVRFQYPTEMLGEAAFELDDDGTPYWIVPTVDMRIGLFGGRDYTGAILVNPCTGQTVRYGLDEVPEWVDKVFNAGLVYNQLDYYGKYRSGFWNSIIGQSGVLVPTGSNYYSALSSSSLKGLMTSVSGGYNTIGGGIYNYLAIDDDVYMYTGMTSANSDESLVGFVLINLRTKSTRYYTCAGATESSAMSSAEGQVQQMEYEATSPLLLNIADRPTYFLSLKDDAGLVKMYAFIDVEQYQIVGTGSTINTAQENYISALSSSNEVQLDEDALKDTHVEAESVKGTVAAVSPVVVDGNTIYYFMLEGDENIYTATVSVSSKLAFLKAGDKVELTFNEKDSIREVSTLE